MEDSQLLCASSVSYLSLSLSLHYLSLRGLEINFLAYQPNRLEDNNNKKHRPFLSNKAEKPYEI